MKPHFHRNVPLWIFHAKLRTHFGASLNIVEKNCRVISNWPCLCCFFEPLSVFKWSVNMNIRKSFILLFLHLQTQKLSDWLTMKGWGPTSHTVTLFHRWSCFVGVFSHLAIFTAARFVPYCWFLLPPPPSPGASARILVSPSPTSRRSWWSCRPVNRRSPSQDPIDSSGLPVTCAAPWAWRPSRSCASPARWWRGTAWADVSGESCAQ